MRIGLLAAGVAGLGLATAASAQTVIIDEDFESYSTTAGMTSVWQPVAGTNNASLDTTFGNPGQSAWHFGGVVNEQTFANVNPTAADPIIFSGQLHDDRASDNNRMSVGIRGFDSGSATTENIIELGRYNAVAGRPYMFRIVSFGVGTDPNWQPFNVDPVEGWHTYSATITDSTVTVAIDLLSDGTIDDSQSFSLTTTALGFDRMRFGGPSGVAGTTPIHFDNLSLVQGVIPEPGTMALAGIAGLGLLRRRR